MKKTEIFEDVVAVMREDAACCKDRKGGSAAEFRARVTDDMTDEAFLFAMKSYLATFDLTGHLSIQKKEFGILPFFVQRYEDALYVIENCEKSALSVGDKIIEVDGCPVKEYVEQHKEFLHGETEERQGAFWTRELLPFAGTLTYEDGKTGEKKSWKVTRIKNEDWIETDNYVCKDLGNKVTYVKLLDFNNQEEIEKMFADNAGLLEQTTYLLVDVRANKGGTDTAFLPLLKYCLPDGETISILEQEDDYGMEINYSRRNCELRKKNFEEILNGNIGEETRGLLEKMAAELDEKSGQGFCVVKDDGEELPIVGDSAIQKVYILTDENCGSSGDAFVLYFGRMPKVTVIGRPTMGILDYSNCSRVDYGEYVLLYPTSRLLALDHGIVMMKKGVPVDEYIPWTPESLERDVELEKALDLIAGEQNR